jgi:hypothetical protein
MIAILAEFTSWMTPLAGALAQGPDRTPEVILMVVIVAAAAVAAAIALRKP